MHLKVRSHLSLLGAIHCIFKDYCNACYLTSSLLLPHIKSCILRKSCRVGDQSKRSVRSTVAIGRRPPFCLLTRRLGELLACICVRSHENTKQLRCRNSQEGDSCRGSIECREWLPWCSGMMDSTRHQDTVRLNLWLKYNGKDLPRYSKHFIIQHFYLNYEVCLSGWTKISVFSGYETQNGVTFGLQVPVLWLHSRMHPGCWVGCVPLSPQEIQKNLHLTLTATRCWAQHTNKQRVSCKAEVRGQGRSNKIFFFFF